MPPQSSRDVLLGRYGVTIPPRFVRSKKNESLRVGTGEKIEPEILEEGRKERGKGFSIFFLKSLGYFGTSRESVGSVFCQKRLHVDHLEKSLGSRDGLFLCGGINDAGEHVCGGNADCQYEKDEKRDDG